MGISVGAGRGGEPKRAEARRILSPIFTILQRVASERSAAYNVLSIINIQEYFGLQAIARKCRKVGNEQPSKQPLAVSADSTEQTDSFSQPLQQFSGFLVAV